MSIGLVEKLKGIELISFGSDVEEVRFIALEFISFVIPAGAELPGFHILKRKREGIYLSIRQIFFNKSSFNIIYAVWYSLEKRRKREESESVLVFQEGSWQILIIIDDGYNWRCISRNYIKD